MERSPLIVSDRGNLRWCGNFQSPNEKSAAASTVSQIKINYVLRLRRPVLSGAKKLMMHLPRWSELLGSEGK